MPRLVSANGESGAQKSGAREVNWAWRSVEVRDIKKKQLSERDKAPEILLTAECQTEYEQ